MAAKKSILLSVLKLTKTSPVQKGVIQKEAKVNAYVIEETLRELSEGGFIRQQHNLVVASPSQRVSMAVRALKLGADFEQICKFLEWNEFESIAAQAFQANGFRVLKNFRFKHAGKRWEIDVLSCREPLVVCVDCKHWLRRWSRVAAVKAVEAQIERTRALADSLPNYYQKAHLTEWKSATLIPLVLSLVPGPLKFCNNVPIVPILQLQDFINKLPIEVNELTHFKKEGFRFEKKLINYCK